MIRYFLCLCSIESRVPADTVRATKDARRFDPGLVLLGQVQWCAICISSFSGGGGVFNTFIE